MERLNPLAEPGWDELLLTHPGHGFFHGAAWAGVLGECYGHQPAYFTLRESGRLLVLLAVMEVSSRATGRRGVSLPFTDECPPLLTGAVDAAGLFKEVVAYGRERGWKHVEWRGRGGLTNGAPASLGFYAHSLALGGGEEELFAGLDSACRRAVRKAHSSGVRVEISTELAAVGAYYSLHCITRQKHGLPPQPYAFFRAIWKHVLAAGQGLVALAKVGDRPVAGGVFFYLGGRAIYKYGASDQRFQQTRASNLMMWEGIRCLAKRGCQSLHFGRTSIGNEGLRRYKKSFGAEESALEYVKYDLRKDTFVVETDKVQGWYNQLFSLMPVPLLRLAGGVLYPHMA